MPLTYHHGQIEVQTEANTRPVADNLAHWVGPVGEFAGGADLILLAASIDDSPLLFSVVSGQPPLIEVTGPGAIRLPALAYPEGDMLAGGLAITLASARRARINGTLSNDPDGATLAAHEAFTNCRKYIAPSLALDDAVRVGPERRTAIDLDDPWLAALLDEAETAFLATVSPDGQPDVSHRGGPPGFLSLDAAGSCLSWPEYIGDGMLKSAGNVRATGDVTLLVLDIVSGDAAELSGNATYETLNTYKQARSSGLERHDQPFPVQGRISLDVTRANRLHALMHPRQRLEKAVKFTSASPIDLQAPQ